MTHTYTHTTSVDVPVAFINGKRTIPSWNLLTAPMERVMMAYTLEKPRRKYSHEESNQQLSRKTHAENVQGSDSCGSSSTPGKDS